jgi:hypothetical protein
MEKLYNDKTGLLLVLPFCFSVYTNCELFTFFNIFWMMPAITYHLLNFITGTTDTSIFVLAYRYMDLIIVNGVTPFLLFHSKYDNIYYYISVTCYLSLMFLIYSRVLDSMYIHITSCIMLLGLNISGYLNYETCYLCY